MAWLMVGTVTLVTRGNVFINLAFFLMVFVMIRLLSIFICGVPSKCSVSSMHNPITCHLHPDIVPHLSLSTPSTHCQVR